MHDDFESIVKSLIGDLRQAKGWPRETDRMTMSTGLQDFHIAIFRPWEINWFQETFNKYIRFSDLVDLVHRELNIPLDPRLDKNEMDWKTIGDVVRYMRNCASSYYQQYDSHEDYHDEDCYCEDCYDEDYQDEDYWEEEDTDSSSDRNLRSEYLRLMDLPDTASIEEIRRRYHQLVKECHPDHHGSGTSILFRKIQQAYEYLMEN